MSSVHVCVHLWYLSGLVVNAVFVGQHTRIALCVFVFVCVFLEEGFRLQLLSIVHSEALRALIFADEDATNDLN